MAQEKWLYETTLDKVIEEKLPPTKEAQGGETVEITRTVRKIKPVKLALLQADRRIYKGAELFYAKTLAHYLKEGLLPYSLVAKRFANDGGSLSETDKQRIETFRKQLQELEKEFFGLLAETEKNNKDKKNDLLIKINDINTEITKIQNANVDIFESTAEVKSRNDTMEWWALYLIYIDEDGKGYKPLFGDGDYNSRYEKLEAFENQDDFFYGEVIKRLSFLVMFWFTAQNSVSKIDMKDMEKLYIDKHSDYKIDVSESTKVEEKTT